MSLSGHKLISKPAHYIIGKTTFDEEGLKAFIEARKYQEDDRFMGSPIHNLMLGTGITEPGQDETELMSEFGGRFCYDSFMRGRGSEEYIHNILDQRHGSVLQHPTFNIAIDGVSRSLSMELIRHHAGFAISQESQRFVDAKNIRFVVPPMMLHLWGGDVNCAEAREFQAHCENSIVEYSKWQDYIMEEVERVTDPDQKTMLKKRANEAARSVLPNCAETRLLWTGNVQALRWFCEVRGAKYADLEIRRLACDLASTFIDRAPFSFSDVAISEGEFDVPFTTVKYSKV